MSSTRQPLCVSRGKLDFVYSCLFLPSYFIPPLQRPGNWSRQYKLLRTLLKTTEGGNEGNWDCQVRERERERLCWSRGGDLLRRCTVQECEHMNITCRGAQPLDPRRTPAPFRANRPAHNPESPADLSSETQSTEKACQQLHWESVTSGWSYLFSAPRK